MAFLGSRQSTDRHFTGLRVFSTTIATDINDLPVTSPHGSDFGAFANC